MMLPLPTVSNIDVTAERLKDVERDAARPLPDLAGGATKALQAGAAAVEMGEQQRLREEARRFQTEYVDKGWEGADRLWKERGSKPDEDWRPWRASLGDTAGKYFEFVGRKSESEEKAAEEKSKREAAAGLTTDPAQQAALRAGALEGKDVVLEQGRTQRAADAAASRERIAAEREATQRARTAIIKLKEGASPEQSKALDEFLKQVDDAEAEYDRILSMYLGRFDEISEADNARLVKLRNKIATANSNAGILRRRGAVPSGGSSDQTVWRKAADGMEYEYNSETRQPTGKSRKPGGQ